MSAAAHAHDDPDDRDAHQIEPALALESGGEQRALDATESDGDEVGPQGDGEERLGHTTIVNADRAASTGARARPR